jgi:hypothetical protein
MLEAQCTSWGGIISATVYWPRFVSNASEHSADAQQAAFDAARLQLAALHAQMESRGGLQHRCHAGGMLHVLHVYATKGADKSCGAA